MMQPVNPPKKCFMVKDRVGLSKASTYTLPDDPLHIYGMPHKVDDENCGQSKNHSAYNSGLIFNFLLVLQSWVASDPSINKVTAVSYVHSNMLAIKNGCITATAMRQYIEAHPRIRLIEESGGEGKIGNSNHEGPFGIKTKL